MTLETVTLKLPRKLLKDAGAVASAQDVTIGHLVRHLLSTEVHSRLKPKTNTRPDGALLAVLQALLAKDMADATGWDDLARCLAVHGYELRPAGGGIVLYKTSCGTRVCKGSDLGFAYRTFVERFRAAMPGHPHGALNVAVNAAPNVAPLDSTTKGRLQRDLERVVKTCTDWRMLQSELDQRGYMLRPMGMGTAIYSRAERRHLCNTKTVGYRYRALVKKFGAPLPGHPYGADWFKGRGAEGEASSDSREFDVIERDAGIPAPGKKIAPTNSRGISMQER